MVGENLADGCAVGNIFASPDPITVLEVTKSLPTKQGVLYLIANYAGDNLNFGMAADLAKQEGIKVEMVSNRDDVLSAPATRKEDRRGIAGGLFVTKIAGAAATRGNSLSEVAYFTTLARESVFSAGIALSPCSCLLYTYL